jgi:hypothetical protein
VTFFLQLPAACEVVESGAPAPPSHSPSQARRRRNHLFQMASYTTSVDSTRLTCATADPNCCHLGCTAQALWATKLPAPSQARAVGPAELTVRRRCPVGSRTTVVAKRSEGRPALARLVRESGRGDGAKLEAHKSFGSNEKRKQATRVTCATADPNCCHLGCTSQAP